MNGIEILNQTQCHYVSARITLLIIFLFMVAISIFFIGLLNSRPFWFVIAIVSTTLLLASCVFLSRESRTKNVYTQYQVTVSEKVTFEDFMNKYDILFVDGKIYTVVDKGAKHG